MFLDKFLFAAGKGDAPKERRNIRMEFLDIRDKNGNPTGEVKERSLVHADGDIHGTSHVWIVRKNEKGSYDLLLQKRSENKDAFPGCYDISSAGHLPAGQDYLSSALRELEEELGIKAKPEQLHFMGLHEGCCEETFYGKPFKIISFNSKDLSLILRFALAELKTRLKHFDVTSYRL